MQYHFSLRRGSSWRRNIYSHHLNYMDAKHWISLSCLRRWKGRSQPFLLPTQSILSSGYRLQKLPQERLKNKLNKLRVQTNLFCIVFNFLQTPAFSLLRGKNSGGKCARALQQLSPRCSQSLGGSCGLTSHLFPTFLISPLLAVWKSAHLTVLQLC